MELRSRPSRDEPSSESVRVLPPEAGSRSTPPVPRPRQASMTGPVVLLVAVLVAGGAGLLYGYSLGDDAPSEANAETETATSVPATSPPTTAAPVVPFPTMDSTFTPAGRGHLVPDGATEWLNGNTVYAVAVHPDGSLWSAGPGGVVQWNLDGGAHVRRTTTDGTGPVGARDLTITDDGEVWVIGDAHISHWDGEEWLRQSRFQGSRSAQLVTIAATGDGSVWVGSSDWERNEFGIHSASGAFDQAMRSYRIERDIPVLRGAPDGSLWVAVGRSLWQVADGRWIQVGDTGLPGIEEFAVGPDGAVLIARDTSVVRWDAGSTLPISDDGQRLLNNALGGFIRWIVIDRNGVSWAVARSFGSDGETTELIRLDDLARYPVPAEFTSRPVAAADGSLWMGTEDGIIGFDDGTWRTLRLEDDDIPLRWVDSMAVDGGGTVWMAGPDEVASWDGGAWSAIGVDDVLEDPSLRNRANGPTWVTSGPDGALWAGAGCHAAVLRDGRWTPIGSPADIEPAGFCWAADRVVGADGALLLLVEASVESARGVHRWDGASWTKVADIDPERGLFEIAVAADGSLWGSGQGVMRFEDGEWTTVFGGIDVETIAASADGSIWVAEPCWWCPGESGGVWRFIDGNWTRELELRVSDMAAAADGTVWVIGQNSENLPAAWRYEDGRFRPLLSVEPFTTVATTPDGGAWLASPGRLLHIPGD